MKNIMSAEHTYILSLTKLISLLSKYSYSLVSTYCVGDNIRFVEVRTPRFQKTFVIYIPPRYEMTCGNSHKRFQITNINLASSRQLDYLMDIKGPLIDCDLLSISSTILCLYKNNGNTDYYKIGEDTIESIIEEPEIYGVEKVIRDAKEVMKRVEPEDDLTVEDHFLIPEDLEHMKLIIPEKLDTTIELEFEENQEESAELVENSEETPKKIEDLVHKNTTQRRDNPIPPTLEDSDINLGIVYYSIDIGTFYKRSSGLEEDIMSIYNSLDDNEDDIRSTKITEITLLTEKIVQKAKNIAEKIKKDETELKSQLITLSAILEKTETIQGKIEKDKKKFADVKPDIDRVYNQTKTTIYDINVELLRNRDTTDDTLNSIQTSLEEILNI